MTLLQLGGLQRRGAHPGCPEWPDRVLRAHGYRRWSQGGLNRKRELNPLESSSRKEAMGGSAGTDSAGEPAPATFTGAHYSPQ